jgi:signal transduction histidine kinase
MRVLVLSLFAVNLAGFIYLYSVTGHPVSSMPIGATQSLGLVSTVAASLYVAMMALFYANALTAQVELGAVMRAHMAKAEELLSAVKEAERAGAAKSDFLAKISHELRTPLNAVIGYSEMLLEDMTETGETESVEDVKKIHGAGHFLLKLVNEVLDLSKIEAGKMEVNLEPVDLGAMIGRIGERHRPLARQNGLDLNVTCDPALGVILTDPAKLENALGELIDNAIKFTREGSVDLTGERIQGAEGDEIAIRVRDTGAGIAPERMNSLFEQFSVAGDTSSSKYGGTGLGLTLGQKISRLLGGDLTVESQVNVGSCFTIQIPARGVEAAGQPAADNDAEKALRTAEAFHQQLRPLAGHAGRETAPAAGQADLAPVAINA